MPLSEGVLDDNSVREWHILDNYMACLPVQIGLSVRTIWVPRYEQKLGQTFLDFLTFGLGVQLPLI